MTDRPRALAVLIAVFLLGCILGSAASYFYFKKNQEQSRAAAQTFRGPRLGRQRMPDLKLTPEQEAQFGKVMEEMRRQLDELRTEQEPKFEAIRAETNQKLMSILNDEQKKTFSGFVKEMENRRMRSPHGGRQMNGPPPEP